MAEIILTHFGDFSQGHSDPIPVLRELKACSRALMECTEQALRAAIAADETKGMRKGPSMIEEKGLPRTRPFLFLTLS